MTVRGRRTPILVALLCGGCGSGAGAENPAIDTSLGLDFRPKNAECTGSEDFPEALSDHPCFSEQPPRASDALIPYQVNAPLWSDGADKMRYLALPDTSSIAVARDGSFEIPPESVLVKEFSYEGQRLETRFLVTDAQGHWHAATYVWNEAQDDASLSKDGPEVEFGETTWKVPSEEQCFECHTDAAGITLGLEQRQMDLFMEYAATGREADQLHTLIGLGMLDGRVDDTPLASPFDAALQLEERARAYLHANCAHCHRPGGLGEGEIDLRASTPFRLTKTCNQTPNTADPIAGGGVMVSPGAAEESSLYLRMTSSDPTWRMPPVGSDVVDTSGSELIAAWIDSLQGCP